MGTGDGRAVLARAAAQPAPWPSASTPTPRRWPTSSRRAARPAHGWPAERAVRGRGGRGAATGARRSRRPGHRDPALGFAARGMPAARCGGERHRLARGARRHGRGALATTARDGRDLASARMRHWPRRSPRHGGPTTCDSRRSGRPRTGDRIDRSTWAKRLRLAPGRARRRPPTTSGRAGADRPGRLASCCGARPDRSGRSASIGRMTDRTALILDVDTGIDDSLALLYAAASPGRRVRRGDLRVGQRRRAPGRASTPAPCSSSPGGPTSRSPSDGEVPLVRPLETTPETHGPQGLGHAELPPPIAPAQRAPRAST